MFSPLPSRALRAAIAALALMGTVGMSLAAPVGTGDSVTTPQVTAQLLAHAPEGIAPGKPLQLALQLAHQPHWHTYWKNPGDSGLPTTLVFTLPPGFEAGDVQWPAPQRLPVGPLMNYGYEGRVVLPVEVRVPSSFSADPLEVKLQAEWLVCKDVCIPQSGSFALQLPVRAATAGHAGAFAAAQAARPQVAAAGVAATARIQANATAALLHLVVAGLPAAWQGKAVELYPETPGVLANTAAAQPEWKADGTWQVNWPLDPQRSASPTSLPLVFKLANAAAPVPSLAVLVQVQGAWPGAQGAQPNVMPTLATPSAPSAPSAPAAPDTSFIAALGLAFVGGLLLNLMPCVFPVLSLKLLGFAQHSQTAKARWSHALAYALGVVGSCVALAALLLALRAGGEQLGWGFQLQSPGFVAALAALFALMGLNLAGLFEVGQVLPSAWMSAQAKHPTVDSLLTGVLAVAVASPCTAPFMGAALGLAVGLPAVQALTIFAALGLGLALPFVLAAAWPPLARALPRPGPWLATFKGLMAFPMFATVVWLLWVLGQQAGLDAAAAWLGFLLALALSLWLWTRPARAASPTNSGGAGAWVARGAALASVAAGLAWAWPYIKSEPAPDLSVASAAATSATAWQAWSPERVAQAQAAGQPVFVDFTAAWCVTCQFNKRSTLAQAEVMAAFASKRLLLLRADWTRPDARIAAELTRMNRSGVPVYALYAPGQVDPHLLPELLSPSLVLEALAKLPSPS